MHQDVIRPDAREIRCAHRDVRPLKRFAAFARHHVVLLERVVLRHLLQHAQLLPIRIHQLRHLQNWGYNRSPAAAIDWAQSLRSSSNMERQHVEKTST